MTFTSEIQLYKGFPPYFVYNNMYDKVYNNLFKTLNPEPLPNKVGRFLCTQHFPKGLKAFPRDFHQPTSLTTLGEKSDYRIAPDGTNSKFRVDI
jgi:hypothetical protein